MHRDINTAFSTRIYLFCCWVLQIPHNIQNITNNYLCGAFRNRAIVLIIGDYIILRLIQVQKIYIYIYMPRGGSYIVLIQSIFIGVVCVLRVYTCVAKKDSLPGCLFLPLFLFTTFVVFSISGQLQLIPILTNSKL